VQLGYFPHGPSSPGAVGLYIDTLPKALLTSAACLALFALFSYALVLAARMHASVARALLRPPRDPLAQAKDPLRRPPPGRLPPPPPPPPGRGAPPAIVPACTAEALT